MGRGTGCFQTSRSSAHYPHHGFWILVPCLSLSSRHLPPAKMLLKTGRAALALNLACGQYLTGPAITLGGAKRSVQGVSRSLRLPVPAPHQPCPGSCPVSGAEV